MTWTQLAVMTKVRKRRERSDNMGWEIARCIGETKTGRIVSAVRERGKGRRATCDWSKMLTGERVLGRETEVEVKIGLRRCVGGRGRCFVQIDGKMVRLECGAGVRWE